MLNLKKLKKAKLKTLNMLGKIKDVTPVYTLVTSAVALPLITLPYQLFDSLLGSLISTFAFTFLLLPYAAFIKDFDRYDDIAAATWTYEGNYKRDNDLNKYEANFVVRDKREKEIELIDR